MMLLKRRADLLIDGKYRRITIWDALDWKQNRPDLWEEYKNNIYSICKKPENKVRMVFQTGKNGILKNSYFRYYNADFENKGEGSEESYRHELFKESISRIERLEITIEITEKLDGKNGGYIWGELLVDPISRKYFSTKLYEDEKREKERAIAELNQVKKLYGQVIDTNKQLREQIQLLDRNINVYKNKLSGFEAKLRITEQENTEIKSSFWYKLFGRK